MQHFPIKTFICLQREYFGTVSHIIYFLFLTSEAASQSEGCVSCSAPLAHGPSDLSSSLSPDGQAGSSSPSLEGTWQQPRGQQTIGEEKVTLYLLLGPEKEDKSSFQKKSKWDSVSKTKSHLSIVGHLVTLAEVS